MGTGCTDGHTQCHPHCRDQHDYGTNGPVRRRSGELRGGSHGQLNDPARNHIRFVPGTITFVPGTITKEPRGH